MRAKLLLFFLFMFTAHSGETTCSRVLRITGDESDTLISQTEAEWFSRFLAAHHCRAIWLGSGISTQRRLQMMVDKQVDVIIGASFTAERDVIAQFSAPFRHEKFYVLARKSSTKWTSLDDYLAHNYF